MEKDYEKIIGSEIKKAVNDDKNSLEFFEGMTQTEFKLPNEIEKKLKRKGNRFIKAAVILVTFFICSSAMAVFMSKYDTVQAVKLF